MAIQNRRGPVIKLDPNKLLPAEFAAALDVEELHFCFAPGETKRVVFSEDVIELIDAHTGEVVATLTADVKRAVTDAETAAEYANTSAQKAVEKSTLAESAANDANAVAEDLVSRKDAGEFTGPPGPPGETGANGVVTTMEGQFGFEIREGHLYLVYPDGTTPPDMRIDDAGHLILTI
nr:MAG TPA: nucleoid-associated protein [Bacteriophage sp.]